MTAERGRRSTEGFLLFVVVAAVVVLAGTVGGATLSIGFDEFEEGTALTDQYDEDGVRFEPQGRESAGAYVRTCGAGGNYCAAARSPKNAIVTPLSDEFHRYPLVVAFEEPQSEVWLYVRETRGFDISQTARLVARTGQGNYLTESSVEFESGTGWHRLGVSDPSGSIAEITLTSWNTGNPNYVHNSFVVDDLTFRANDPPEAAFGYSPTTPTAGDPTTFSASNSSDSDGEIVEYRWDFDGDQGIDDVSRIETTTHTFPEPGTYRVTLFVEDDDGAVDSQFRWVAVEEAPVARCSIPDTDVAPDEPFLIDASESHAELVRFDVDGDGTFERTNQGDFRESVSYPESADLTPRIRAEIGEATDTVSCPTVTVNEWPTAVLSLSSSPPTVGVPVTLDASESFDDDGEVVRYLWDLDGDGSVDRNTTSATVTHVFEEPGAQTVSLTVVDDDGATGRTEVTVEVNDPPTAVIDGASTATVDDNTTFSASSSSDSDGEVVEYRWDFDDDGVIDRNTTSPMAVHVFEEGRTYTVSLTVVDDDGGLGRAAMEVDVNERPAVTVDPSPVHPTVGDTVTLDASGSFDPDGEITEYRWDFDGDGSVDRNTSSAGTTYVFEEPGAHTVSLTVVDDDGTTASGGTTVRVNALPTPAFEAVPDGPTVDEEVRFDASRSTDEDGEIVEYRWDFDDGTPSRPTRTPRTTHTFDDGGDYTVSLTVVDDDDATARTEAVVEVNVPPTAAFGLSREVPTVGEEMGLDASGSTDEDGELVRFSWDFDDDGAPDYNTSRERIRYTFGDGGEHAISLTVHDDDGATARAEATVEVNEPPIAVLSEPSGRPRLGEEFTFDASGSSDPDGEVVQFVWDFDGDGGPDHNTTSLTATHVFEEPGAHTVSMGVVDDDGAIRWTQISVEVTRPPSLPPGTDVVVAGTVGLAGALTLRRIRTSTGGGGNSGGRTEGRNQTTEEKNGDERHPKAKIWYAPSTPLAPCPVVFDAGLSSGLVSTGGGTTCQWTIDGQSRRGRRVVVFFAAADDYDVELKVWSGGELPDTATETVTVEAREGELALDGVHPTDPGTGRGVPDRESVVFRNTGNGRLDLGGWTVRDVVDEGEEDRLGEGEHVFEFPDGFGLDPDETVTVHTGPEPDDAAEDDGADGGNHLFWGERRSIWNPERDVVVVEDDGEFPVMAVRYERSDSDEYEYEDLDVEVLEDWFPEVVISRREDAGASPVRVRVGVEGVVAAVSSGIEFAAGATFLRGSRPFLRSWALLTEFVLMSSMTWVTATTYAGIQESIAPRVPWLLFGSSLGLLVVGAAARRVAPLREWFDSQAS